MRKNKKILKFWVDKNGDIYLDNTELGYDETEQTFNLIEITKINSSKMLKICSNDIEMIKRKYQINPNDVNKNNI